MCCAGLEVKDTIPSPFSCDGCIWEELCSRSDSGEDDEMGFNLQVSAGPEDVAANVALDVKLLLSGKKLSSSVDAAIISLHQSCLLANQRGSVYRQMVVALPGVLSDLEKTKLAGKFTKLLGAKGRLNPSTKVKAWTTSEDRRLTTSANAGVSWSDMKKSFSGRTANDLRDRARHLLPNLFKKTQRCAYGISGGVRCANKRGEVAQSLGISFQSVPNVAKVLSHMSIKHYSANLVCCSAHGQNPTAVLSANNLQDHSSQTPSKKRSRASSRQSPTERSQEQERRRIAKQEKDTSIARALERKQCLDASNGDSNEAIDGLLRQREEMLAKIVQLEEQVRVAQEQADVLRKWVQAFRPESWDDVDDDWVTMWTPFRNKAAARAFFVEEFVLPRVPFFESWANFDKHKLQRVDTSQKVAEFVAACETKEGKLPDRFSRSKKSSSSKKGKTDGVTALAERLVKKTTRTDSFRAAAKGDDPKPVPRKATSRTSYAYKPHTHNGVSLSVFQEFLVYMIFLRRGLEKSLLADKFFGSSSKPSLKCINSIIRTYASAVYEILSVEKWWLSPGDIDRAKSKAFADEFAQQILTIADCTNFNCEGSDMLELIRQQLYSIYYSHECGKYCVGVSKIGGCTVVSPGQGGPASDHQCMEAAGLFDKEKWAVEQGSPEAALLYDAGVSAKTKTLASSVGCSLVTSGMVRKSKASNLSGLQRSTNFNASSLRIRVENFIGILKQRFQILGKILQVSDLGIMDKIVFACCMLHNFGPPIIY